MTIYHKQHHLNTVVLYCNMLISGKFVFSVLHITVLSITVAISLCYGVPDSWICSPSTDNHVIQLRLETNSWLNALENQVKQLQKLIQEEKYKKFTTIEGFPRDCEEIYANGTQIDGIYAVSPDGRCPFFVYCDMTNGGWTVIQRRVDGSTSFYRKWNEYVTGFGELDDSHWLGLERIHRLTNDGSQIFFDIENYDGSKDFAHYKVFTVHGASTTYTMNVDPFGYKGTISELLSYHNNFKFSTYDRDNDGHSGNCCKDSLDGGGWWYSSCYRLGNVNGVYGKQETGGIGYWTTKNIPIKNITIKVKRMDGVC
ncbi:microfibril-associated glycoprotein 4-like [Mercenaria mercenaria]|uniref:microfibril-associated glycoprotein 4-like n=1 Tax=Mercenaria mercenaria TaxID=6596 RepID=UPI00234E5670|nr:microfibril-associated glycoprotein 4-like [Mercenaria mercenaria]